MNSVRVFISSTFSDFADERNILHQYVFPRIEKLCRKYHCSFYPIDLRWGISEQDSQDYSTLDICLNEIRRCVNITPRPNFIFLAGDRYGWRPLPSVIPEMLFVKLLNVLDEDDKALIKQLYLKDDNAIPAEYCLRMDRKKYLEDEIRDIFNRAARNVELSEYEHDILFASATHRELLERYEKGDFPQSAVCAIRNIINVPVDKQSVFYDMMPDGQLDTKALENAKSLKAIIKKIAGNPIEYTIDMSSDEESRNERLAEFANQVYEQLERYILDEISNAKVNLLNSERTIHLNKSETEHAIYAGSTEKLESLTRVMWRKKFLSTKRNPLVVVTGNSGTGKTALINEAYKKNRGNNTLIRFIGLTGISACFESLSRNLDAEDWRSKIVFLDGIDQIDKPGKLIKWFFADKSPDQLVISMTDACYEAYCKLIPEHIRFQTTEISSIDIEHILDRRLKISNRTLEPNQREAVLDAFNRTKDTFFLTKLAEIAVSTSSFEGVFGLDENRDYSDYIENLLRNLTIKKHLGPEICSRMTGYLLASRQGLSEKELIGVLSMDRAVINEFESRSFHMIPGKNMVLPYAYFSRVFYAISHLLQEFYSEGERVYRIDRNVTDYVKKYTDNLDEKVMHSSIADYLIASRKNEGIEDTIKELLSVAVGADQVDSRYAWELPYQLQNSGRFEDLYNLLCDTAFVKLMHVRNFEEYIEYWAFLEKNTNYRVREGFADLLRVAEEIAVSDVSQPEVDAGLITVISDLMIAMGGFGKEIEILSDARVKLFGGCDDNEIAVLQAASHKVQALLDSGKYEDALKQATNLFKKTAPEHSVGYASVLYVYAQALYRNMKYGEALKYFTKQSEIAKSLGNRDHIFSSLKWMASSEKSVGNIDEAMKIYDELAENYADDDKLSEIATILFEQGTAIFATDKNLKRALECFDKAALYSENIGNKTWLWQIYDTTLNMLSLAEQFDEIPQVFRKYCHACTMIGPDTRIGVLAYINLLESLYKIGERGAVIEDGFFYGNIDNYGGKFYDALLRTMESFPFMELAGNIELEDIPDCKDKYIFYNTWKYVFDLLPEGLQMIIRNNHADYDFFLGKMQKGKQIVWGEQTYPKIYECVNGVYTGELVDEESIQTCKGYASFCSLIMFYAYSVLDRCEEETRWGEMITLSSYLNDMWNVAIYGDSWIKANCYFVEYRFRKTQHLEFMKGKKSEYEAKYIPTPDNDPIKKMYEDFKNKDLIK